jgi:cytochrome c oxidase assembly protein subunit 15
MAGTHAATYFPTWPDMNGQAIPPNLFSETPVGLNFLDNRATIQFFHRGNAYLLFMGILIFSYYLIRKHKARRAALQFAAALLLLAITQVLLGIFTLLGSAAGEIPVLLGVLHQCVGLILFTVMLSVYFYFRNPAGKSVQAEPPVSPAYNA